MSHLALTGAGGFLGWHTRAAAHLSGSPTHPFSVGEGFDASTATAAVDGAARLLHIAGVNRASEEEVRDGNLLFARQVASALQGATTPPPVVVFANSSQVGNGSVYGHAKEDAAAIVRAAAEGVGARFVDLHLPNLFGEHGKPFYNSVVSTFCHLVATGGAPTIDVDKDLTLLHAQDAADLLLGAREGTADAEFPSTVTGLLASLRSIDSEYSRGGIPPLEGTAARALFNTYRSYVFAADPLRSPAREIPGSTETHRLAAGESVDLGITRRGIRRLTVAAGTARLRASRSLGGESVDVTLVAGDGHAFDVPTLWECSVRAEGDRELVLAEWADGTAGAA